MEGSHESFDQIPRPGAGCNTALRALLRGRRAAACDERLCADDKDRLASGMQWLEGGRTSFSVAEVYAAHRKAGLVIDAGAQHSRAASGEPVAVLA